MRVAVLAWGSLVWDRRSLEIEGDFRPTGPRLPIEFCRVSSGGRLTLVLEEALGTPCVTYAALSAFGDLDAAIENLRVREGMPTAKAVGHLDLHSKRESTLARQRHPDALDVISAWARENGLDAVVWTALATNFDKASRRKETFSTGAAIRHLELLHADEQEAALTYIRRAPREVQTPVRSAVLSRWATGD